MATQAYRDRSDETVAENSGTSRPVHPARPELPVKAGSENKTPAPLTTADLTRRKDTAWGRAGDQPQDQNPGKNGFGGPSSIPPGTHAPAATVNPMAPRDLVLDAIVKGGAHGAQISDDWQTREVSDTPFPSAMNMRTRAPDSGSPGSKVPAATSPASSDADARRSAAVKRTVQ